MGLSKRTGLLAIATALLAALLAACAAPAPTATPTSPPVVAPTPTKASTATPTKRPLVKGTLATASEGIHNSPTLIAQDKGYFREEGFDLDIIVTGKGNTAVAAVVGGSAVSATTTPSEPVNAAAQGASPIVMVAALYTQPQSNITIRKDVADRLGINEKSPLDNKLRSLKGLRIGTASEGGITNSIARYVLRLANLDPERDVEIMAVGATQAQLAALQAGQVDIIVRGSPTTDIPVAEGWGIRLINVQGGELPALAGMLSVVDVVRKDYSDSRPEEALAVVRATTKALKFLQREAESKEYVRKFFTDVEPKIYDAMWISNYRAFPADAVMTKESVQKNIDLNAEFSPDVAKVKPEQVIDNRFAEQAKRELADWRP